MVGACGPKSPESHRVVWGLTSRPPVSPAGFPPVSRLPAGSLPFVRLLLVSLRPAFSGLFPSAVARVPVPRWSRAAGTKVSSPAATTSPGSRDPRALQMGNGWARWNVATESPVTSGREAGHRRARAVQIGSRARAATSDRHAMRPAFQNVNDLIDADSARVRGVRGGRWPTLRLSNSGLAAPPLLACAGSQGANLSHRSAWCRWQPAQRPMAVRGGGEVVGGGAAA